MILLLLSSCKKDGLQLYAGPSNVYFATAFGSYNSFGGSFTPGSDSLDVNFGWASLTKMDSIASIVVTISGKPASTDRAYKIKIDTGTTAQEGIHYDLIDGAGIIRAGKVLDTFKVKIKRTAELQQKIVLLNLTLESNENFATDFKAQVINGKSYGLLRYRVKISDMLTRPPQWSASYWGTFTKKKFYLCVEVLDIPFTYFFSYPGQAIDQYNYVRMARYLNDEKAAGRTVYEDDGTEMKMGPFAY